MKMKDEELESWQAVWSGEEGPPAPTLDARRIAAQGRGRLVRRMALEIVVAVGWIAVAVIVIRLRPDPALMVLGACIIAFVAVASAFSIWNSTGIWQPAGDSVRDFVLLASERCRRDLRGVRFGLWFAAIETALLIGWLAWTSDRDVCPRSAGCRTSGWSSRSPRRPRRRVDAACETTSGKGTGSARCRAPPVEDE